MTKLLLAWVALLLSLAAQYAFAAAYPPLAVLLAALMCGIVAFAFMDLAKAPRLAAIFAGAGLLWAGLLLSLGGLEYATRIISALTP